MSQKFDKVANDFFTRLYAIQQKSKELNLSYQNYQTAIQELHALEREGLKTFTEYLQDGKKQNSYCITEQIQLTIEKWQKETSDLLNFLKKKAPKGLVN